MSGLRRMCWHLSSGEHQLAPRGFTRDDALCTGCGSCVAACPTLALEATGWRAGVDEVMAIIRKDIPFYDQSGGGVTFSGGEPLFQPEFLLALLWECGRLGLHRAVDTSGFAATEVLMAIARETELFLYDVKHMDSAHHQAQTGVANALILKNLRLLVEKGHRVQVRLPLIPGVNDDEANLHSTAAFVAALPGVESIDVLPYHRAASAKYRKLGRQNPGEEFLPAAVNLSAAIELLQEAGLQVRVGG